MSAEGAAHRVCRTFGPPLIAQPNPRPHGRGYYLPGLRPWLRQVSFGFETVSSSPSGSPSRHDHVTCDGPDGRSAQYLGKIFKPSSRGRVGFSDGEGAILPLHLIEPRSNSV